MICLKRNGWLGIAAAIAVIGYIGYLHYKIVVYKMIIADALVVNLQGAIIMTEALSMGRSEVPAHLAEAQIVSLWVSLESGSLKAHPGRPFWRSYILKTLGKYGKERNTYPTSLIAELKREHFELIPGPEFYESWNYPMMEWWP